MSFTNIFNIAGSGMSAQLVRLNTVASNLGNSQTVAGSAQEAYKARMPVYSTGMPAANEFGQAYEQALQNDASAGVHVTGIVETNQKPRQEFRPNHPLADAKGFVYMPAVNQMEEMTNMMSASRSYQTNLQVMETSKELMMRTLRLGQ